jgi:hypothetical protein
VLQAIGSRSLLCDELFNTWKRQLFVWDEELLEVCCTLLHNIILQNKILDKWLWRTINSDTFSVKKAYLILTNIEGGG